MFIFRKQKNTVPSLEQLIKEMDEALLYDPLRDIREKTKYIPRLIAVLNAIKEKKIAEKEANDYWIPAGLGKYRTKPKNSYVNASASYGGGYIHQSDCQNNSRYTERARLALLAGGALTTMLALHYRHKKR